MARRPQPLPGTRSAQLACFRRVFQASTCLGDVLFASDRGKVLRGPHVAGIHHHRRCCCFEDGQLKLEGGGFDSGNRALVASVTWSLLP